MPHETALIATIAAGIALAFLLGFVAARLRLPPLVGYGRVGSAVGATLAEPRVSYIVVEENRETVETRRVQGVPIFYGDAVRPGVLHKAGVQHARLLVVATSDPYQARAIIDIARAAKAALAHGMGRKGRRRRR
jgi:hypothetical protein